MSPITPMQLKMLDSAIGYAVQENVVFSNWPLFRDYLVANGCLGSTELDGQREFVFDCYLKHNSAKELGTFRQPDTPPKSPENEPRAAICNPATGLPLGPVETTPFSPTLDTSKTKHSENLSIFVKHANTWDGTGWDFCTQEDSFISTRIVQRNSLEVKEQRTEISWKFHGEKKTYRTWFIVVDDENMEDDIMLGKNWDNIESQTRAGAPSQGSCHDVEQPLGMNTLNDEHSLEREEFSDTTHARVATDAEFMSQVEARVARLNVHSTVYMEAIQRSHIPFRSSYSQEGMPPRRHVEDVRSDSSGSQGHQNEKRLAPSLVNDLHPRSSPRNPGLYTPVRPPEESRPL